MSSGKIGIFVATMTGLAEICAEEIAKALADSGAESEKKLMDGLSAAALEPFEMLVIVSSTYGHGDIPDNGQGLFESIAAGASLSGKRYAIFALGDRTYADTFCAAGEKWDLLLSTAGAVRITELQRHDASAGTFAEDVAGEWAAGWANAV